MCLKDNNAVTPVMLKPAVSLPQVKHSTTEPLRSLIVMYYVITACTTYTITFEKLLTNREMVKFQKWDFFSSFLYTLT